jgi:hypothetical protein
LKLRKSWSGIQALLEGFEPTAVVEMGDLQFLSCEVQRWRAHMVGKQDSHEVIALQQIKEKISKTIANCTIFLRETCNDHC